MNMNNFAKFIKKLQNIPQIKIEILKLKKQILTQIENLNQLFEKIILYKITLKDILNDIEIIKKKIDNLSSSDRTYNSDVDTFKEYIGIIKCLETQIKNNQIDLLKEYEEIKKIINQLKLISLNKSYESFEKIIDDTIILKKNNYLNEREVINEYNKLKNKTINELNYYYYFKYELFEKDLNKYLRRVNRFKNCSIF